MTRLDGAADELAILGGRDEVGGGTWLATNEAGVVAGLTSAAARWPDHPKRSAESSSHPRPHRTAAAAVDARHRIDPSAFNPSWLWWPTATRFLRRRDRHDQVVSSTSDRVLHVLENALCTSRPPRSSGPGTARSCPPPWNRRAARQPCAPCSPTIACQPGEPPADASNPRLPWPHEPSAFMPTRTTTGRVRPPSSPSRRTVRTNHPLDRRFAVPRPMARIRPPLGDSQHPVSNRAHQSE